MGRPGRLRMSCKDCALISRPLAYTGQQVSPLRGAGWTLPRFGLKTRLEWMCHHNPFKASASWNIDFLQPVTSIFGWSKWSSYLVVTMAAISANGHKLLSQYLVRHKWLEILWLLCISNGPTIIGTVNAHWNSHPIFSCLFTMCSPEEFQKQK